MSSHLHEAEREELKAMADEDEFEDLSLSLRNKEANIKILLRQMSFSITRYAGKLCNHL